MSRQDSPKGRRCRSRRVGAVRSDRLPGGPPRGLQARCWRERAAPDLTKVRLDQEGRDGPRRVGNCVSVMRSRLPLPRVSVADRVAQCCESVDYLNQPTNDVLEAVVEIRAFVVDAKALRDRLVLARKVPLVVFAARRQRLLQRAASLGFENNLALFRVAERPEQKPDQTSFPVLDESGGVKILEFDNADPQLDLSDPRVISYAGQDYLTTMSHLRLVASGDGMHFREPRPNPPIFGVGDLESYGIEDCRVVEIKGTYYLTFTQVSQHGVAAPGPGYICGAMLDAKANNGGCNQEWQFPEFTAFPSGADGDQMHNLLGRLGPGYRRRLPPGKPADLGVGRASHAWAAPVPMVLYSDEYDFPD